MPRATGLLHPTDVCPLAPSTVYTFLLTGGSSAQASDWVGDSSTAVANAATAGIHHVRITPLSTAGGAFFCTANLFSTAASVPSSGITVSSTSNAAVASAREFQVSGGSTGFSVAAYTSGIVMVECWKK
jgi:hypothetical protein